MQKQPASVTWLIHSLEILALGGAFTAVATVYNAFTAGNFNLASGGVALVSVLVAFLSNGLKGIISNANFFQAISDLKTELAAAHQAASPVTIHNNLPAPTPAAQIVSTGIDRVAPPAGLSNTNLQPQQLPSQQFAQPFSYQPQAWTIPTPAVQPGQLQ